MCNMQPSDKQLDAQHQNSTAPLKSHEYPPPCHVIARWSNRYWFILGSGKSFHKLDLLAQLLPIFLGCNCLHGHALFRELAVHMPVSGSFGAYARKYISPSTGYMISWMYWLTWTATLGTEFTAAALLMQEWFPQISMWIWTLILQ